MTDTDKTCCNTHKKTTSRWTKYLKQIKLKPGLRAYIHLQLLRPTESTELYHHTVGRPGNSVVSLLNQLFKCYSLSHTSQTVGPPRGHSHHWQTHYSSTTVYHRTSKLSRAQQTGRQTERQADRQTDRQTDRQADRQTDRPRRCAWKCRGGCVRCQSRTSCSRHAETEALAGHREFLTTNITSH